MMDISARCTPHGATYVEGSYDSASGKFDLICACGTLHRAVWDKVRSGSSKPQCRSCTAKLISETRRRFFKERLYQENLTRASETQAIPHLELYQTAKDPLPFTCACGKEGTVTWTAVKFGRSSMKCETCRHPRGENHPNWREDLADRTKRIHLPEYKLWEKAVKERASFTCQVTGREGGRLSSHHLYNWGHYPDYRLLLENGVCVSYDVHQEFHNQYGRGHNTYEQFAEFFQKKTGRPFHFPDPRLWQ